MKLILLALVAALMQAALSFAPQPGIGSGPAGTALACGFLLVAGFLAGEVLKRLGLPRLTGYLLLGLVAGPRALALVTEPMVRNLKLFNGVAIALIALTAGSDIDLRALRPLLRSVLAICLIGVLGTAACIALAAYAGREWLPFMTGLPPAQSAAIALVLGLTMAAQSPAVVVALRDELQADGPLTRTVLAVVVLSDLMLILFFAAASLWAKSAMGVAADAGDTAARLGWEILGSGVAGIGVGVLLALYLTKILRGGALFVILVCFVIAQIGNRLDFDPLLVALAAGILIRNGSRAADRLQREINAASLPVYVAFFSLTGASLELAAVAQVGVAALALVVTRAVGFLALTRLGARLGGAPTVVERFAGIGMLPQAGLALALAILFRRTFPELREAAVLVVVGVALNELVGPVLYRLAIVRSGEAQRLHRRDVESISRQSDSAA